MLQWGHVDEGDLVAASMGRQHAASPLSVKVVKQETKPCIPEGMNFDRCVEHLKAMPSKLVSVEYAIFSYHDNSGDMFEEGDWGGYGYTPYNRVDELCWPKPENEVRDAEVLLGQGEGDETYSDFSPQSGDDYDYSEDDAWA